MRWPFSKRREPTPARPLMVPLRFRTPDGVVHCRETVDGADIFLGNKIRFGVSCRRVAAPNGHPIELVEVLGEDATITCMTCAHFGPRRW